MECCFRVRDVGRRCRSRMDEVSRVSCNLGTSQSVMLYRCHWVQSRCDQGKILCNNFSLVQVLSFGYHVELLSSSQLPIPLVYCTFNCKLEFLLFPLRLQSLMKRKLLSFRHVPIILSADKMGLQAILWLKSRVFSQSYE